MRNIIFIGFLVLSLYAGDDSAVAMAELEMDMMSFFYGTYSGMIIMASVYAIAIYLHNKHKAYLYYGLMQLSILAIFGSGIMMPSSSDEMHLSPFSALLLDFWSELPFLFAVLFTASFLETAEYTPKLHKVLFALLWIGYIESIIDNFFFHPPDIMGTIYIFFILFIFPTIGWIRWKQGFSPARYYFLGWGGITFFLVLGLVWDTMFLLAMTVEILFFALALSEKVKLLARQMQLQQSLLIQQSKLASMGEMLGNIAHQWRQPLTRIGYMLMNIDEESDNQTRHKLIREANTQLKFASDTINDFTDFYKQKGEKDYFWISDVIDETLVIIENTLQQYKIDVQVEIKVDFKYFGYKNDLKQILINLLTNSKEICIKRSIKQPSVFVTVTQNRIEVSDNAGGIKKEILNHVFEPYFSTKENGLGIGLYMTKKIVEERLKGSLEVKNSLKGAMFRIEFGDTSM